MSVLDREVNSTQSQFPRKVRRMNVNEGKQLQVVICRWTFGVISSASKSTKMIRLLAGPVSALDSLSSLAIGITGSIPGSGIFFHKLSVTGERISTEYWLTVYVKPAQEGLIKDN